MADLYNHDVKRFSDAGLQLRLPVDLVPPGQYSRLTNGVPIIEGRIDTRGSLLWIVNVANTTNPGSGLHSLSRLNQPSVSGVGDRVAGIDTTVQTFALPSGNVATSRDTGRTGDPLSLPQFHFNNDVAAWQVISDRAAMNKYRGGSGTGLYYNLGITSPLTAPSATIPYGAASPVAGGAGNLNSTGGPGYDWVYTFVNTGTNSESNPSQPFYGLSYNTGGNIVVAPGANTSPDPGFGGSAATLHANTSATLNAASATETRQSCLWTTFQPGTPPYIGGSMFLFLDCNFIVAGTSGCVYGAIYFSLDGGNTWKVAWDTSISRNFHTVTTNLTIALPATTDLTRLQVRAVVMGVGNTTVPQNVTARRIRDRAGNFPINDLLTGGGGNRTITLQIFQIQAMAVTLGTAVSTLALTNQSANVTVSAPTDPQDDAIRLYRRGGSVTASWAFVGQFTVASLGVGSGGPGTLLINDNIADTNLGQFVQLTNDAPITSVYLINRPLPYVWGPGLNPARLFGCGDPDRPDAVYFSNPGNADQWASSQWVDVSSPSDPMQNGCTLDTRVFAFSKERLFELTPSLVGGATITPYPTPCSRGLISPWGLWPRGSAACRAIYFVAKDGIYMTTGGQEQSLVENDIKPIFPTLDSPGRQVENIDAVNMERIEDIRLGFHNDELYFIYRGLNSGNLQMLVWDQNKQRWRAATYPVAIETIYSEEAGPASSLLLGDSTGSMYTTQTGTSDTLQASTSPIAVNIRTGAYDQGVQLNHKEYGSVIFDIDPGGATVGSPVTITPYVNGEAQAQAAITVTGTGRQQVPLPLGDILAYNLEFDIAWSRSATINPILYQFDILYRLEPVSVTHFETRESSYGLPGFLHARDANVCIRSTATVNLTMTFDGTVQTYQLASTGGQRRKVYVPFNSNKGKLYRFSFDAADGVTPYKIYFEDTELRLKPWLTNLGYQVLRAFGAESPLVSQDLGAQILKGGQ